MSETKPGRISDFTSLLTLAEKYSLHKGLTAITIKYVFDNLMNIELLKKAFNIEIERNDSLRERFVDDKKDKIYPVKSYFVKPYKLDFGYADFTGISDEAERKKLSKIAKKPIKLRNAPFGRVTIIKTNNGKDGIVVTFNHYNLDAYGFMITMKDVFAVYLSLLDGVEMPAPLANWQSAISKRNSKNTPDHISQLSDAFQKHFTKHEAFSPYKSTSCFDAERSTNKRRINFNSGRFNRFSDIIAIFFDKAGFDNYKLDKEYADKIKSFCRENNITLDIFWYLVMRTYHISHNGRAESSLFDFYANNRVRELKYAGGCCVNRCLLKIDAKNTETIQQVLDKIYSEVIFSYKNIDLPYVYNLGYLVKAYGFSGYERGGLASVSVIPIEYSFDEKVRGEVEYISSGYCATALYHLLIANQDGSMSMYFMYQLTHYDKEQTGFMADGYKRAINAITTLGVNATLNELYDAMDRTK